jgi:hypothetical protein
VGRASSRSLAIDAKFQDSLAQLRSGLRVEQGIRVGEQAADTVLASRAHDGANVTPPAFTPGSGPGEH